MKVVVVGGGAAGMMAAYSAALYGSEVTLLERNEKLGKKIYITGKGRCNITNNCSKDELMKNVIRNPKFLYSAFEEFDNRDVYELLESKGLRLKVERGDRVFPESDRASDVIRTLSNILDEAGVEVRLNTYIKSLSLDGNVCKGVVTDKGEKIDAQRVILCTGGVSYPTTGSDGNLFDYIESLGHEVKELRPALVPYNCNDEWIKDLQGLALKNVEFYLCRGDKIIYKEFGEMLFTHFGISGPIVLSSSGYYEPGYKGYIDLKPALSYEKLDERILRDFSENSNKDFENALDGLFPKKLIHIMVMKSGIDPHKKVHQITSGERQDFVNLIKKLPIDIASTRGFNEAIITRGGINVKEVDPSTMYSKMIKGVSFAGEMLDLDAFTGGFNLQIAWSTGYLAGSRANWE